jgi:3-deoxy-D-manno-octulosonic acid (KDO) 8-phosphate synthase
MFLIAGPCAIESREMALQTAETLGLHERKMEYLLTAAKNTPEDVKEAYKKRTGEGRL